MADRQVDNLNVEIGAGVTPLIDALRDDLRGSGPAIFIDSERSTLESLRKISPDLPSPDIISNKPWKQSFIVAEANNIPLAQDSCGVILAVNVVGHKHQSLNQTEKQTQNISELAKSWHDKLKTDGKVVIVETFSPEINPKPKVKKAFLENGFTLMEEYDRGQTSSVFKNYGDTNKKHPFVNSTLAGSNVTHYALVFKKISK